MKFKKIMVCLCALMMFMSVSMTAFASDAWVRKTINGINYGYRVNSNNSQVKATIQDPAYKNHEDFKVTIFLYNKDGVVKQDSSYVTDTYYCNLVFDTTDVKDKWTYGCVYYVMDGKMLTSEYIYPNATK